MSDRLREMTRLLHLSATYRDPNRARQHITGLQHALRCAALSAADGDEAAFVGLVHDLGRPLNDVHHGEVIAWAVKDRVSDLAFQLLHSHGRYQEAIVHGLPLPNDPWRSEAARFAGREARSFQPDCPAISVEQAAAMLHRWLG